MIVLKILIIIKLIYPTMKLILIFIIKLLRVLRVLHSKSRPASIHPISNILPTPLQPFLT